MHQARLEFFASASQDFFYIYLLFHFQILTIAYIICVLIQDDCSTAKYCFYSVEQILFGWTVAQLISNLYLGFKCLPISFQPSV